MRIQKLIKHREELRRKRQFAQADKLRSEIESRGYRVTDTAKKSIVQLVRLGQQQRQSGLIALFGSGEMSPTGRRIHEYLINDLKPPVRIALLETPAGFEVNPHHWYQKLQAMMEVGLANAKPKITLVEALTSAGKHSTNDPNTVDVLLTADYIHTGAGSPTFAARHLRGSRAYHHIIAHVQAGKPASFASAAALSMGKYLLPVYEIYKVGEDLHWNEGLDFFAAWGINLSVITHWNNSEVGEFVDTSRCFMGRQRFQKLLKLLPGPTTILGIDEQTALIIDLGKKECLVQGSGGVTLIAEGKEERFLTGNFPIV